MQQAPCFHGWIPRSIWQTLIRAYGAQVYKEEWQELTVIIALLKLLLLKDGISLIRIFQMYGNMGRIIPAFSGIKGQ